MLLDVARANSCGIGSPYKTVEELYITDAANSSLRWLDTTRTTISRADIPSILFNVRGYQERNGVGCGGWGFDMALLPSLAPALVWFVGITVARLLCREPLARFGMYMGVTTENSATHARRVAEGKRGSKALSRRNQQKILKFQNQVWLTMFYVVSSVAGYLVQRDKPWFALPMTDDSSIQLLVPHPYLPPKEILTYYHYGLAFYMSELFALFFIEAKIKRSDFYEYTIHHLMTLALIVCSHLGWEHRFGVYVLLLHDASDIMLSFSKSLHYMTEEDTARCQRYNALHKKLKDGKRYRKCFLFRYILTENTVNVCFGVFVVIFFYLRLYCLPMLAKATFGMAPMVRHGNFCMWLLVFLLNVALQALHVYWAALIVSMIVKLLLGGERKDIRSECDSETEEPDCVIPWHPTETKEAVARSPPPPPVAARRNGKRSPSPVPNGESNKNGTVRRR